VIAAIEAALKHDRAGDPMTGLKWTRRTTAKIAEELKNLGIEVCPKTVARILKQLGFSLRVNHKKLSRRSDPDRDEQFLYIAEQRERFARAGQPVVAIDTKKKELIGQFKNPGCVWSKEPTPVNDHDFRSDALGIAAPYGLYDTLANRGSLYVGTSHDTPEFAADNVARWWRDEGEARYPEATELLLLADGGGSNGYRNRAFKYWLQNRLCDPHSLVVTVCHYPTGASKWNPVDHRLFSEITKNWAGRPLDSFETLVAYASTTRTATGLTVRAQLLDQPYKKGLRISRAQMSKLDIEPHATQPKRNYTIYPRV
jgi:hypothetical protein